MSSIGNNSPPRNNKQQKHSHWPKGYQTLRDNNLIPVFKSICEEWAARYDNGELTAIEAVDWCQAWAYTRGLVETLGQDEVQRIMAEAFLPYRGDDQ
jgi:hypothetical protein